MSITSRIVVLIAHLRRLARPSLIQFIFSRFGHGSDFAKLASSERDDQADYVVGVSRNMQSSSR